MQTNKYLRTRLGLGLFLTFILIVSSVTTVQANVRTEDGGDVPFYARIGLNEYYHTDEWAVIVFYRPTECIPSSFNMLDFFDIPGAFACGPYTTDGFAIWQNGPGVDSAPIMSQLFGLDAVPVWFVSWPALVSAVSDGVLTIEDLEAMSPLIGSASYYQETLQPTSEIGHPSMIEFVARGTLTDGRVFDVKATETDGMSAKNREVVHIIIK